MVCVIKLNEVENLIESLDKEGFLGCVEVVNIEKIRVEGNLENILLKVNFNNIILTSNNLEMAIEYVISEDLQIETE